MLLVVGALLMTTWFWGILAHLGGVVIHALLLGGAAALTLRLLDRSAA